MLKNFNNWKEENYPTKNITCEDFSYICKEYFSNNLMCEGVQTARYSVEVNYRTNKDEALEGFAKITLGFVSAALKNYGFHTKHVFTEKPLRLLVSSRNWDDGEWVGIVTFNPDHDGGCFVVSKGFFNKDRNTTSIQSSEKCSGSSAAEITQELRNMMHDLKDKPDRHQEKLKGVPMKRGPKR